MLVQYKQIEFEKYFFHAIQVLWASLNKPIERNGLTRGFAIYGI